MDYFLQRALEEYYDYSRLSTCIENSRYLKRYLVIESSNFMRNIFWLASCFFKIKKPNSHFLGNQSGIAGFPIFILK